MSPAGDVTFLEWGELFLSSDCFTWWGRGGRWGANRNAPQWFVTLWQMRRSEKKRIGLWRNVQHSTRKSQEVPSKNWKKIQMQLKHMCCIYGLYWLWFQRDLLARVLLYNMPVQTPLNVYESCGAESLCYWADGWRLESFSSGSGKVEIADRWVMTALQKAIYSAVAGRSWPWYTTLCSRLLFPAMILSWLAESEKSRALLRCMQMNVW